MRDKRAPKIDIIKTCKIVTLICFKSFKLRIPNNKMLLEDQLESIHFTRGN